MMDKKLIVKPNKNEFLLYAMLNAVGLAKGDTDSHFLRRRTVDHFQGYKGKDMKEIDDISHSRPVSYVLTLNEAPDFSEKNLILDDFMQNEIELGKEFLPHLINFYENTDFEDFYQKILPRYKEECDFVQGILERAKIKEILDNVWELDKPLNMEIIPMPLERVYFGIGPIFGDTAYQIVGPPFDHDISHLVAHEGSHPRAKRTLEPIADEIATRNHLLQHVLKQPNYSKSYPHWPTCFEEHFIRAMHVCYIDPALGVNSDVENQLSREEKDQGMSFIRDFYDEISKYKKNPKGSLQETALKILDRLDRKYQSKYQKLRRFASGLRFKK